ncbi:MAG: N-acetylmuramoyl-L-alanine amidase [Candidatus Pacebacteria bacterium]|nr:N-acetylmuramoyl-L-alanine amidase [Candidatus Paceibacterota bacterium]
MKYYLVTILALMLFGVPAVSSRFGGEVDYVAQIFSQATEQLAAVILSHNPKTVADIKSRYTSPIVQVASINDKSIHNKVRILIVPGHEPNYGGAEYSSLKERDMTVELAQDLAGFLEKDTHYEVFVTRDGNDWSPIFAEYFKNNWQNIIDWQAGSAQDIAHRISSGTVVPPTKTVYHNKAPSNVAYRLYGITKWANENDVDITIHIHFNDAPGHGSRTPGDHTGFAIYIPERQYANSATSKVVAETIFKRLSKYNPVSSLTGESAGIVEDPDLIAIGAHDTADAASMLIEYGYIYEPQFLNAGTRDLAIKDLAFQTYLGLEDFFSAPDAAAVSRAYDTVALPHTWKSVISEKNTQNTDVFALQSALLVDGEYPPYARDLSDCPRTGKLGPCTQTALQQFQKKYSISGETNIVGQRTMQILNTNYGISF